MKGGGNKWTDHIHAFAKRTGVSYMCAMSDPACSAEYKAGKPVKVKKSRVKKGKTAEREQMGMEDIDAPEDSGAKKKFRTAVAKRKLMKQTLEADKAKEVKEGEKMGIEDLKSALLRKANAVVLPEQSADKTVKRPKGRPKKYETAEEARQAKIKNTIEASKRRQAEKRDAKAEAKLSRAKEAYKKLEDKMDSWYSKKWRTDIEPYQQETFDKELAKISKKFKGVSLEQMKGSGSPLFSSSFSHAEVLPPVATQQVSVSGGSSESSGLTKKKVLENYDAMVMHLIGHITDPEEPVDTRDYDQVISIIKDIKKLKGGIMMRLGQDPKTWTPQGIY